jgi:hypothetical protein
VGHIRLGELPHTRKWRDVLALLADGAPAPREMVLAVTTAADDRLRSLESDPAISYLYWLLARVTWLSRTDDFLGALRSEGIRLPQQVSGLTFLGALGNLAAAEIKRRASPSLTSELALRSFKEALARAVHDQADTLFGTTLSDVQAAFKSSSTPRQFARLARDFFGTFLSGFVEFVVSKESSRHVGWTRPFRDPAALGALQEGLSRYCYEVTRILEDFSGGWYSKHNWMGDIDKQQAARFVAYAFEKVRSELGR